MGVVYRALDCLLGRTVALKQLAPTLAQDEAFRARFMREAKALGRLRHPNVVAIHDIGEHAGAPWFTMDLCRGGSLRDAIRGGPLACERVRPVAIDVADALTAIHGAGLVHRDLKPENILRDGQRWMLSDFGIVRDASSADTNLTDTGFLIGTPEYWAPEYLDNAAPTPAADMYSLGCVLYCALVGSPPYLSENRLRIAIMHATEPVPSLPDHARATDSALAELVEELLAKDPTVRPTARDVLARIAPAGQATTVLGGVEIPWSTAGSESTVVGPAESTNSKQTQRAAETSRISVGASSTTVPAAEGDTAATLRRSVPNLRVWLVSVSLIVVVIAAGIIVGAVVRDSPHSPTEPGATVVASRSPTDPMALSADELRTQADAICGDVNRATAAIPEPTSNETVLPFLQATRAAQASGLDRLRDLEPPADLADTWHEAIALNEEQLATIDYAISRIGLGEDPSTVIGDLTPGLERRQGELRVKASELGLSVCGAGGTNEPAPDSAAETR